MATGKAVVVENGALVDRPTPEEDVAMKGNLRSDTRPEPEPKPEPKAEPELSLPGLVVEAGNVEDIS